jgi:nicotinamidase-related amidase
MADLTLNPATTALVLIDLQNGILARPSAPYSGAEVQENARTLAATFRAAGAPVVYVHVDVFHFLQLEADKPLMPKDAPPPPPEAVDFGPESGYQPGDLTILKRHFGAFAHTELEAMLRERGVKTVVIGGVSTNIGVESTVRQGTGLGFHFVIAEDASTAFDPEAHRYSIENFFPMLSRVRTTKEIVDAMQG